MATQLQLQTQSPWPHRLAVLLCCATFPLIWVGGLVTTYDAGMAVPDWPTTYGYNLFLYPWQTWLFGPFDLFIEHGHRLLGATVGLLAIGFVIAVFRCEQRGMRTAAVTALALVIAQGILGGIRVRMNERGFAMIHACFGLATFAYLAAMVVATSRFWNDATQNRLPASSSSQRLQRLSVLTAGMVYVQVVLGAMLRHVPPGASHQFFRLVVFFHLLLAAAVVAHVILVCRAIRRDFRGESRFAMPATILFGLVLLQLMLGGGSWVLKYGWPAWISELPFTAGYTIQANSLLHGIVVTSHMAIGALILSQSVVLALRAARFFRSAAVSGNSGKLLMGWTA